MKKVSKSLFNLADVLIVAGVIILILAVIGFIFSDDPISGVVLTGFVFLLASPVVRGLGVIVKNAEEQLDARWLGWSQSKNNENEDKK